VARDPRRQPRCAAGRAQLRRRADHPDSL